MSLFNEEDTVDRLCHVFSERNAEEPDTISFWEEKLKLFCKSKKVLSFRCSEVVSAFSAKGIIPTSFNKSFSIMKQKNEVVRSASSFNTEQESVGQFVLSTALSMVKNAISATSGEDVYVCMKVLRDAEVLIQNSIKCKRDFDCVFLLNAISVEEAGFTFRSYLSNVGRSLREIIREDNILETISSEDASLIANSLVQSGKAVLSEDKAMIKLLKTSSAPPAKSIFTAWLGSPTPAPAMDHGESAVLRLRISIRQLEERVKALEDKADGHRQSAVKYKAAGNDRAALLQLNLRRNTLQQRDKIEQSLMNLTEAYERIDEVSVNVMIANAYKAAALGLKSTREKSGMTVESVEEAMEDFQNEMDEMKDISSVLESDPNSKLSSEEEEELGLELEEMMKTMSLVEEASLSSAAGGVSVSDSLPQVPLSHVAREEATARAPQGGSKVAVAVPVV